MVGMKHKTIAFTDLYFALVMEMWLRTILYVTVIMLVITNCLAGRSKSDRKEKRGRGQLVSVTNFLV